ncbi:MAG: hypothetical protein KBC22_03085 [Candidatus Pacebacteria bacterium]|nr:hypothetical protein [Candidatus Paceibacterota bacterium]
MNGKTIFTDIVFTVSMALWWFLMAVRSIFSTYHEAYTTHPYWTQKEITNFLNRTQSWGFSIALSLYLSIATAYMIILNIITIATMPWDTVNSSHMKGFGDILDTASSHMIILSGIALILHNVIAHIAESIMAKESPPS